MVLARSLPESPCRQSCCQRRIAPLNPVLGTGHSRCAFQGNQPENEATLWGPLKKGHTHTHTPPHTQSHTHTPVVVKEANINPNQLLRGPQQKDTSKSLLSFESGNDAADQTLSYKLLAGATAGLSRLPRWACLRVSSTTPRFVPHTPRACF